MNTILSKEALKQSLSPEQFNICCHKGTEAAFSGKYVDCKQVGIYACVCCGNGLFSSKTKYDSGSGWPSFWKALTSSSLKEVSDETGGMQRIEVICQHCQSHLGHVFPDGPPPTGLRYCINSASLKADFD